MAKPQIAILGIYVADLIFRAPRLPAMGETLLGESFAIGPGGKGSNQAVAAARAGGAVSFISCIGEDAFADIAKKIWSGDGVDFSRVETRKDRPTGGAFIFVSSETGNNAIIVETGAAQAITPETVEAAEAEIKASKVFVTQLEPPLDAARRGLEIARKHGVITIFNPAPGLEAGRTLLPLADFATPNESETEALTGMKVATVDEARKAAGELIRLGAKNAVITLGAQGVLLHGSGFSELVPGFKVKVVDTTGAGDAFNGGFAVALAEGSPPLEAARFGNAVAALSVTKPGTAPSMPYRQDVEALLASARI
jgi:ribokinase